MIDVFIATITTNPIRRKLFEAVLERWHCERDIMLHIQKPQRVKVNVECIGESDHIHISKESEMQRWRRIAADVWPSSDIYIVTDDDCMPIGADFIERGLAVMNAHPQHAVLAAINVRSDTLFKNGVPPYCGSFIDDDVWECHAVGGIRFCRKGVVKEWPQSVSPGSYDMQHQEGIEKAGYKAGYLRNVLFNHLGEGLSTHWPSPKTEIEQLEEMRV